MTARRALGPGSLGVSALLALTATAAAAPEDRGPRGWYVGAGGGVILGQASDAEGRDPGSFLGSGGRLRVGDEALPGFGIGLAFYGGGGTGENDAYAANFGGLLLELSWRPLPERVPSLLFVGGTGVGGGVIEPVDDDERDYEGTPGGAFYSLGVTWEIPFGDGPDGFALAPAIHADFMPSQGGNEAGLTAFMVGLGTVWYGGR
ncbi:MAG: hypothetical protein H6706_05975 [Myxococcales bacterium]|nr:hypothetical protein [Myxococcales bacterium]